MTPAATLTALERRLALLPPPGDARRRAVDELTQALADHGAIIVTRGCAARVEMHGIGAHGLGADGAVRNWCSAARGM